MLEKLNTDVYSYEKETGRSTGSTIAALIIFDKEYIAVNIGDSRIYKFGIKNIQITKDQTLAQLEIDRGNLTPEEALTDRRSHTLLQSLGQADPVEPDFFKGKCRKGDSFLICSDGMYNRNDISDLASVIKDKTLSRIYIALVKGKINHDTGTIDAPIGRDTQDRKKMAVIGGGKEAITELKVLERYKNATLVELTLKTGRTHQIRVHMNYINHPVVNDPVYGKRKILDATGQCLHAKTLGFIHPKTNEYMEFTSELPVCFTNILNKFKEEVWTLQSQVNMKK